MDRKLRITPGGTYVGYEDGQPSLVPGHAHDMTGHLKAVFNQCRAEGRPAFMPYLTVGYPVVEGFVDIVKAVVAGGADIIELGVPFSDPMADGPSIQLANETALRNGVVTLQQTLDIVADIRRAGIVTPICLMGYYNPFRNFGEDKLFRAAKDAGVNGFIIVDLPPEESDSFRTLCRSHHLSFIPLIAPSTTPTRMKHLADCADSFIYTVSLEGTTGARATVSDRLPRLVQDIRAQIDLPIVIGFGISNNQQFSEVGSLPGVDGVVVGSAVVNALRDAPAETRLQQITSFCQTLTGRTTVTRVEPPLADPHFTPSAVKIAPRAIGGSFGEFGGRYAPETLVKAFEELEIAYEAAKNDPAFQAEVKSYWDYIGRPSRLHTAERLSEFAGGAKIWLKREDLNHTGAHKVNNAIAQAILAKRLGKSRIICETGAGQHGVATATICAKLGLPLVVYMGADDVERQSLNVIRMQLLGATVVPVSSGSRTLKDAINEAFRDWVTNVSTTHYLVGSVVGPHPFPTIVRDFQKVIGEETREYFLSNVGKLPDAVVACVGGGSNAIGMFYPFRDDKEVRLLGCEAGGSDLSTPGSHSATLTLGSPGVLHGSRTYLLQDAHGQITSTHSISAGLDYPGIGPEHAWLKDTKRGEYIAVTDEQAMQGFRWLTEFEGIIPALESSHAIYGAVQLAKTLPKTANIVICVSGRGDKDLNTVINNVEKYYADKPDVLKSVQFMRSQRIGQVKP